jgi:hypothetical protein
MRGATVRAFLLDVLAAKTSIAQDVGVGDGLGAGVIDLVISASLATEWTKLSA